MLAASGKVFAFGANGEGQCSQQSRDNVLTPTRISALEEEKITMLAAGMEHSAALTGTVKCFIDFRLQ